MTNVSANIQQALTAGKFNTSQQQYGGNPYLNSQNHMGLQIKAPEYTYFQTNQFQHSSLQDPQLMGQNLDPTFANNSFMFSNNQIQPDFDPSFGMNTFGMAQQANVNPADLNKVTSPGHQSPNLLSAENHPSPGSPHSQHEQFFTPQHSRTVSLDPSSAYDPNQWQGINFAQHRRSPSDQSDIPSAQHSPYLGQVELHDKADRSPFLTAQQDVSNTFGIDSFTLGDQPSYRSPRLLPTMDDTQRHGLGLGGDMINPALTVTGADIYNNQIDPAFTGMNRGHVRNASVVSEIGQADHYPPPTINIEPAPVSRQQSFGPAGEHLDGGLSPPPNSRGRVRSKSDATFSRPMSRSTSSGPTRPSLNPNNSDSLSVRSHSHSRSLSRESSPGVESGRIEKGNRRASTSSINSRDYVLSHVDPTRQNPSQPGSSTRLQKHPATFQCNLCPKRFTRAYNLRSHLRTHTDERPFVCTVCGKAFARQHDRKRHESLHSGEKKFVCKGELRSQPGQFWGCGRRFARADALGRHFRSEAGGTCIKPLLDEEAAERRSKAYMEQQQQVAQAQQAQFAQGGLQPVPQPMMIPMNATGATGFTLPAALLAQYPALQNIDWSQISSVEDPGDTSDVGMGRGSFDASSGGEYFDDGDYSEGYVSGSNMSYPMDGKGQQQQLYM